MFGMETNVLVLVKLYHGYLNENDNFERDNNHAWLQNFTWGDLNENDNFNLWKLIIHGYKNVHGDDLNDNKIYKIK